MKCAEFLHLLRQCSISRNQCEARRLHSLLRDGDWEVQATTLIGNSVVKMYGDCGLAREAWQAFESIRNRNVFSWNIMMAVHSQNWDVQEARRIFDRMPCSDVVSWNSLITLYSRFGDIRQLRILFNRMRHRNVCTWNAMITANAQNQRLPDAEAVLRKMPCLQVVTWNAILSAYADRACVAEARVVFDTMAERNAASWNAMVTAYGGNGQVRQAREMLGLMAKQTIISWNSLIAAFSSAGFLSEARHLFQNVTPERNGITWSTMIAGYARNGQEKEALQLFRSMDLEGVNADSVTLVSVVYACATLPSVADARIVYGAIVNGGVTLDVPLGNNLINMFAKCGSLEAAREVFDKMAVRDPLAWNTMITAYSQAGKNSATFELYHTMILVGIPPVHVTFVTILSSCSHAGLLKNARQHFHSMSEDFELHPGFEHYRCMIDVLGRVGRLDGAEDLIKNMPFKPDAVIWNTLLSACKNHNDLDRAARVGKLVLEMDPEVWSSYILISSTLVQERS